MQNSQKKFFFNEIIQNNISTQQFNLISKKNLQIKQY